MTLTKHRMGEFDLEDTKRLTVYLLDKGIDRIHAGAAEGQPETVLTIFDLRGFSMANADIAFLKFFITCILSYFPKRVSQAGGLLRTISRPPLNLLLLLRASV